MSGPGTSGHLGDGTCLAWCYTGQVGWPNVSGLASYVVKALRGRSH